MGYSVSMIDSYNQSTIYIMRAKLFVSGNTNAVATAEDDVP